jgi:acyl-CoA synthetase (AMP-forming)/AMP-acid ligase II/pimeloyl-ACP methyl ester carboxylesterase
VRVTGSDGISHSWHVLDSAPEADPSMPIVLCVHGNPTWSYLWRGLVGAPPAGWRVIAPDQLGMGYSERVADADGQPVRRTLAQRVQDLGDLTSTLGATGPVVILAHDWGGIISLGWALAHREQLRGMVLTNTAVHQPEDSRPPILIRAAHLGALRDLLCVRTPVFVRSATALSRPRLSRAVRAAYAAPYRRAARRRAVGDFVADIPFGDRDPSRPALDAISSGISELDVPALLLWGPRDPVFGEQYLRDLRERLPQAVVQLYPGASHLLPEDAPRYAADVATWIEDLGGAGDLDAAASDRAAAAEEDVASAHRPETVGASAAPPLWQGLVDRAAATPDAVAVAEVGGDTVTWAELDRRVQGAAHRLISGGVAPGDRVALLIPPSIDLTVAVYAVWRAGAAIVVADKGLGVRGLRSALRSADVDHVIGSRQGLLAASVMGLPHSRFRADSRFQAGSRFRAGTIPAGTAMEHATPSSPGLAPSLPTPAPDAEAAVVFTSGATGPAKGVLYLHTQVAAQIAVIRAAYQLSTRDRIVAAFAPFALYGPALGIASCVPATDVTAPGTLTAAALSDAVHAIDATVVFASPAALRNVVATRGDMTMLQRGALRRVRVLMSAGAPVPLQVLQSMHELMPSAQAHTPYGTTEVLPVTDITGEQIEAAGIGDGVCVGRPLPGVQVRISGLDAEGAADGDLTAQPHIIGEICVQAAHVKERYDSLWAIERASSRTAGWHRTGDVGYLDEQGRLWIQGRLQHLITAAGGIVTPVGVEQRVEALPAISLAAAVGIGPPGTQQVALVVQLVQSTGGSSRRPRLRLPLAGRKMVVADLEITDAVRAAAGIPVAAVLVTGALPVDIRHQSKIDRIAVRAAAEKALAGRS